MLQLPVSEITRRLDGSEVYTSQLLAAASRHIYNPTPCTALDLLKSPEMARLARFPQEQLSCGCPVSFQCTQVTLKVMDNLLSGGFLTRGLYEVYGESATCKTLLCLQLSLQVQKDVSQGGLNGGVHSLLHSNVKVVFIFLRKTLSVTHGWAN